MAQQLRVLAALPEDPGSDAPAPMMRGSKLPVTPSPGDLTLFYGLCGNIHMCFTCAQVHMHIHMQNKLHTK